MKLRQRVSSFLIPMAVIAVALIVGALATRWFFPDFLQPWLFWLAETLGAAAALAAIWLQLQKKGPTSGSGDLTTGDVAGDAKYAKRDIVEGDVRVPGGDYAERDIIHGDQIIQPPAPDPLRRLHQLRLAPADFTGRKDELDKLLDWVSEGGATITGMRGQGGIGKTALALVLAHRLKDDYPAAQIMFDLRGAHQQEPRTPAEAMAYVIRSFHPDAQLPKEPDALSALYISVLADKNCLLLMDNARDRDQVESLIPQSGNLLLVTSRQRFDLPAMKALHLDTLLEEDAHQLLRRKSDRLTDDADVARIAELCGYLPEALRIAAEALNKHVTLTPADYAERLEDRAARLELVDAVLSLSYDLLDEELARRWAALSVFPTDFDLLAAAAVWGLDWAEERKLNTARDLLEALIGYSLVEWDADARRAHMHDLARVYADAKLDERAHETAARRHAEHYLHILDQAAQLYGQRGKNIWIGLGLFDLELANIEAGHNNVVNSELSEEAHARLAVDYAGVGANFLGLRLTPTIQERWLRTGLKAVQLLKDRTKEAGLLLHLGTAYAVQGRHTNAIEYYENALSMFDEHEDTEGVQATLSNLGLSYVESGQARQGIEHVNKALQLSRDLKDENAEAYCLGNLGLAFSNLGAYNDAIDHFKQALEINQRIGDLHAVTKSLGHIGSIYAKMDDSENATKYHHMQLSNSRDLGDRQGEAAAYGNLGNNLAIIGRHDEAAELYSRQLNIVRTIGDKRGEGTALGNLAVAYRHLQEHDKAFETYADQLNIVRSLGDRLGEGHALWNMAVAFDDLSQRDDAIRHAEAALEILVAIEDPAAEMVRRALGQWRAASSPE